MNSNFSSHLLISLFLCLAFRLSVIRRKRISEQTFSTSLVFQRAKHVSEFTAPTLASLRVYLNVSSMQTHFEEGQESAPRATPESHPNPPFKIIGIVRRKPKEQHEYIFSLSRCPPFSLARSSNEPAWGNTPISHHRNSSGSK